MKIYALKGEPPIQTIRRRLLSNMSIDAYTGCWNWVKAHRLFGHPTMTVNKKTKSAHRVSYEAWIGPIPDGDMILHQCDNAKCINPLHLETGDQRKNMADCALRGRSASGPRNGMSKITEEIAKMIRYQRSVNKLSYKEISTVFGLSQSQIGRICRGESW